MKKGELLTRIERGLEVTQSMIDVMKVEAEGRIFAYNKARNRSNELSRHVAQMAAAGHEDEVLDALWKAGKIKAYVAVRVTTAALPIPAFTREQAEEIMRNLDPESWGPEIEERTLDDETVVYEHKG